MLSTAHILAMDSKNLLDVIDNLRIQQPQANTTAPLNEDEELSATNSEPAVQNEIKSSDDSSYQLV